MVDWNNLEISEPPITRKLSVEELNEIAASGISNFGDHFNFPNHTQAVERCVKARKVTINYSLFFTNNILGFFSR